MNDGADEIKAYAQLKRVSEHLLSQPGWTPAMGALIIAGVLPPLGCIAIPDQGQLLEDESRPAESIDLADAGWLLKKWVESKDSELGFEVEPDPSQLQAILSELVKPTEFLIWCYYDVKPSLRTCQPRLLDYFCRTLGVNGDRTVAPVQQVTLDRAVALEIHAAVERERSEARPAVGGCSVSVEPSAAKVPTDGRKFSTGRPGRVCLIEREIRDAEQFVRREFGDGASDKVNQVWARLEAMVVEGHSRLIEVVPGGIRYRVGGEFRIYTRNALRQFLRPSKSSVRLPRQATDA